MSVEEVFYINEEKHHTSEIEDTRLFIKDFYKYAKINFSGIFDVYEIDTDDYLEQFSFIRYFLLTSRDSKVKDFYNLLKKSKYNMISEIQFFASLIATSIQDIRASIEFARLCPIIKNIKVNGTKITIESEYGNFEFESIYTFDNEIIKNFVDTYQLESNCHNTSWSLMNSLNNVTLNTVLLKSGFSNQFYHSYLNLTHENLIIDSALGLVSKHDTYEEIFKPKKIVEIRKSNAKGLYDEAINTGNFNNTDIQAKSLVIAINEQMKRGI